MFLLSLTDLTWTWLSDNVGVEGQKLDINVIAPYSFTRRMFKPGFGIIVQQFTMAGFTQGGEWLPKNGDFFLYGMAPILS